METPGNRNRGRVTRPKFSKQTNKQRPYPLTKERRKLKWLHQYLDEPNIQSAVKWHKHHPYYHNHLHPSHEGVVEPRRPCRLTYHYDRPLRREPGLVDHSDDLTSSGPPRTLLSGPYYRSLSPLVVPSWPPEVSVHRGSWRHPVLIMSLDSLGRLTRQERYRKSLSGPCKSTEETHHKTPLFTFPR